MEEKIWAVKDGFLVHRDGSIYALNWKKTGKMRKVKQTTDNNGYLVFGCNGKKTLAHRFIADCFIANPQNLPCINHKDENKTNNSIDNLEFCDWKYNANHASRNKRISEKQKNHPKKSKKVLQFTKDGVFVKEWVSLAEIERVLGFYSSYISACCLDKYEQAYGFLWKFK